MKKKFTKEYRKKLSLRMMGDKNPVKRPEVREKIRKSLLGDNSPWFGKKHSKKTIKKMKLSAIKRWKNKKIPSKYCKICHKKIYKYTVSFLCGSHARKKFYKNNPDFNKGKNNGCYGKGFLRLGKNNPNFKDGRSILKEGMRSLKEYKEWRKKVYERDNYTCQECHIKGNGKNLECHHIKEFNKILEEFLQQYNQFSPIEDRETLVRLAMKYETFWNINNGTTLCDKCHTQTKNFNRINV